METIGLNVAEGSNCFANSDELCRSPRHKRVLGSIEQPEALEPITCSVKGNLPD